MTLIDAGADRVAHRQRAAQPRGRERHRRQRRRTSLSPRTLLSGLLRFLVLAVAVMIIVGPLGFYSADIVSAIQRAFFGFKIGEITISPSGILFGLLLFGVVLVVTRLVRGWMHHTLLPRTTLDAGLQNSIATIVGYSGVALAMASPFPRSGSTCRTSPSSLARSRSASASACSPSSRTSSRA